MPNDESIENLLRRVAALEEKLEANVEAAPEVSVLEPMLNQIKSLEENIGTLETNNKTLVNNIFTAHLAIGVVARLLINHTPELRHDLSNAVYMVTGNTALRRDVEDLINRAIGSATYSKKI